MLESDFGMRPHCPQDKEPTTRKKLAIVFTFFWIGVLPNPVRHDFGMVVPRLQDPELLNANTIAIVLAHVLSRTVAKSDQI